MTTELDLQSGSSLLSFSTRCLRNIPNTYLLELDCANAIYTFPRQSTANIIVILGTMLIVGTELWQSEGYHFLLRKSLIPNQVSSKHIYLVPCRSYRNANAYLCLSIKDRLEFPPTGIWMSLLNFIPLSIITL